MWAQPFRSAATEHVPPQLGADRPIAVLLNANARKVTAKVVRALSHVVAREHLFLSRSELDARRIAQQVIAGRYHTVFLGGGDGTVMCFMNELLNAAARAGNVPMPRLGVLKLGTGNSVATLVKASSPNNDGIVDDVLRARVGEVPSYRTIDLLKVDGKRAPFAGLGVDGKVLNDYIWVKENLAQGPLSWLMTGPGGYFTSVAFKTVPYYLTHSTAMMAEVVNGAGPAYRLGADGKPTKVHQPGEVLFKGKLNLAAAGTVPFYGYELKTFPFAGKRRGMMHLRLGMLQPTSALVNLGKMWKGTWFPDCLHDFYATDVTVRFAEPMPLQIAGDASGYRNEVRFEMATESLELADFSAAVS